MATLPPSPPSRSIGPVTVGDLVIEVVVELEAGSDPIRGSVRSDAGVWEFAGWMELTAALDEARSKGEHHDE